MANGQLLKGLARAGINAAVSAAAGQPNVLEREIEKVETARDKKKIRALQLDQEQFNLDQRRKLAPVELTRQEQALEQQGIQLGFLKDKQKRTRALEDASLLSLAKGDVEAQKKILRKRIINETRLNPKVDLTDTMTALDLLGRDPEAFNRGVDRTLKLGQIMGDIPSPQQAKDPRTILERNAALASTPEGFEAIQRLEQAKQVDKEQKQPNLQSQQVLVNGQPTLVNRNPQTGSFTDLQGNLVDPATIQPLPKSGQRISFDEQGRPIVELGIGQEGVQRGTKTDLEKQITNNLATQARLKRVSDQFQREFLTFKGRALNNVFQFLDKLEIDELKDIPVAGKLFDGLNQEQKESVKKFSAFRRNVEEAFAQFGKSISGAAISEKEFKRLEKAFINAKQSPEQFKAVLDETMSTFERSNRIFQNVINQGLNPNTSEGGQAFDNLFAPAKGQTVRERSIDLNEALKTQITDPAERRQAVLEILEQEGFQIGN